MDLQRAKIKKNVYLRTCATFVKHKICGLYDDSDTHLLAIMLSEGLRKFHNVASSDKGNGKYLGHKYWSVGAWDLFISNNKKLDLTFRKKIRHEHVIPLNYLVHEILFKLDSNQTINQIEEEIEKCSIVAIILRSEDQALNKQSKIKMPSNWMADGLFKRYKETYINGECLFEKIINIENGRPILDCAFAPIRPDHRR